MIKSIIIAAAGLVLLLSPAAAASASWYGLNFHGRKTANGEIFDQYALTAAHKTLPFGTKVLVTHKGKSVLVRINDRGPFVRNRTIDLTRAAARKIGCHGICVVTIKVIR